MNNSGSQNEVPLGVRLSTEYAFSYMTMERVFRYLNVTDLICASQVCSMWKWIINESAILADRQFGTCSLHIDIIGQNYGPLIKDLALYQFNRNDWGQFLNAIGNLKDLRKLNLVHSYPVLQALPLVSHDIKELYLWTENQYELSSTMEFSSSPSITTISYGNTQCITSLKPLCLHNQHLKTLIINIDENFDMDFNPLTRLKELKVLSINFVKIDCSPWWLVLPSLYNLKSLQILNCFYNNFILRVIGVMPKLKELSLCGSMNDYTGLLVNLSETLGFCTNIEKLSIVISCSRTRNFSHETLGRLNASIVKGVQALKDNLIQFLFVVETFRQAENAASNLLLVPLWDNAGLFYLTSSHLEAELKRMCPRTKVIVKWYGSVRKPPHYNCLICNLNNRCRRTENNGTGNKVRPVGRVTPTFRILTPHLIPQN